ARRAAHSGASHLGQRPWPGLHHDDQALLRLGGPRDAGSHADGRPVRGTDRLVRSMIGAVALALAISGFGGDEAIAAPLRVMALDQCADQFVLALAPDAELGLSPRADDPDSWLRAKAEGHRRVRPTLEAAVGFRPDVAVRYWGGDPRLLATLKRDGVRTVTITDAADMDGVRANIRAVAEAVSAVERGEALIARMDSRLAKAEGTGRGRKAVYVTAGGFTTGPGSLMDAVLRAAGFRNGVERP